MPMKLLLLLKKYWKEKYVDAYLCVLEIKKYVKQKYDYILEDEEILFLTIHVAKIILKK